MAALVTIISAFDLYARSSHPRQIKKDRIDLKDVVEETVEKHDSLHRHWEEKNPPAKSQDFTPAPYTPELAGGDRPPEHVVSEAQKVEIPAITPRHVAASPNVIDELEASENLDENSEVKQSPGGKAVKKSKNKNSKRKKKRRASGSH